MNDSLKIFDYDPTENYKMGVAPMRKWNDYEECEENLLTYAKELSIDEDLGRKNDPMQAMITKIKLW